MYYFKVYTHLLLPYITYLASHLQQMYCGYVMLILIVFWCTQVVPLAITALLPILLLPMFGISTSKEITGQYIKVSGSWMGGAGEAGRRQVLPVFSGWALG